MSSKTISVSSDLLGGYFKPKTGLNGGRSTRRNRGNNTIPIPKQQILNEMRAAQQSIMKDASSTRAPLNYNNHSSVPANKPMDAFEESRNYLRQKTAINETKSDQRPPAAYHPPPPPMQPLSIKPKPIMHSQPSVAPSTTQPTLHLPPPSYKLVTTPRFGCLKQGVLPTYRTFQAQNHHSSIMPATATTATADLRSAPLPPLPLPPLPLRHNNFEEKIMVSTAEKAQALRTASALAEEAKSDNKIEGSAAAPHTKTILCSRKYTVGKRRNTNKVGVLISGAQHRETLKRKQGEVKQLPMMELREKLAKRGIVHTTTTAPRHLLQNMYENSCVNLCGELNIK